MVSLPPAVGIFLIYGIPRKELTLVLLALFAENLGVTLTVLLSYSAIIIAKQTNWKYALKITAMEIALALLIGGIINWGYILFSII